jgi:hypothetical protein
LIEAAYLLGEGLGLSVWCCDQAGPSQTMPYPGAGRQPNGRPARRPHEYLRDGTAKVLTLLHPAGGRVRAEGVTACPNAVPRAWLKRELSAILAGPPAAGAAGARAAWERRQQGLTVKPTLLAELPPLRALLVRGGGGTVGGGADAICVGRQTGGASAAAARAPSPSGRPRGLRPPAGP